MPSQSSPATDSRRCPSRQFPPAGGADRLPRGGQLLLPPAGLVPVVGVDRQGVDLGLLPLPHHQDSGGVEEGGGGGGVPDQQAAGPLAHLRGVEGVGGVGVQLQVDVVPPFMAAGHVADGLVGPHLLPLGHLDRLQVVVAGDQVSGVPGGGVDHPVVPDNHHAPDAVLVLLHPQDRSLAAGDDVEALAAPLVKVHPIVGVAVPFPVGVGEIPRRDIGVQHGVEQVLAHSSSPFSFCLMSWFT